MNLEVSPGQLVWPRVVQQVGTASLFAPLSVAAFIYLPKELRGPAAGIFAALRNEGGSAGTALGNTLVTRRIPVHTDRLVENLNPFNPAFNEAIAVDQLLLLPATGDPVGSRDRGSRPSTACGSSRRRHGVPRCLLAASASSSLAPDPAGVPDEAVGRRGGHAYRGEEERCPDRVANREQMAIFKRSNHSDMLVEGRIRTSGMSIPSRAPRKHRPSGASSSAPLGPPAPDIIVPGRRRGRRAGA